MFFEFFISLFSPDLIFDSFFHSLFFLPFFIDFFNKSKNNSVYTVTFITLLSSLVDDEEDDTTGESGFEHFSWENFFHLFFSQPEEKPFKAQIAMNDLFCLLPDEEEHKLAETTFSYDESNYYEHGLFDKPFLEIECYEFSFFSNFDIEFDFGGDVDLFLTFFYSIFAYWSSTAQKDDEKDNFALVTFLSFLLTMLVNTGDLFYLFLVFESLTITVVLLNIVSADKISYNKYIITYYILSVVVSLVIFYFLFFLFSISSSIEFFVVFDLQTLFFDLVLYNFDVDSRLGFIYIFTVKFLFLNLLFLFFFKFSAGPVGIWAVYIYSIFDLIPLLSQMFILKFNLFELFLNLFDFLFFFNSTIIKFFIDGFLLFIFISLIISCVSFKISNLKTIFILTSFAQIGFIGIGYINPSFGILIFSLNYFSLYLFSMNLLFLILMYCNLSYNFDTLKDLAVLRYIDPNLFYGFIVIILSIAGLPPFLGFFVKFALLLKILVIPYLFGYGILLLFINFILMYVYLNIVYSLIKNSQKECTLFFYKMLNKRFVHEKQENVLFVEVMYVLMGFVMHAFIFFLIIPFLVFVDDFDTFEALLQRWELATLLDLIEFYFNDDTYNKNLM